MSLDYIAEALRQFAVPIHGLIKDPRNARIHPDRNIQAIKQSLRQFGQVKPIVLADDGRLIIAGNGTVEAASQLGWSHIAAVTSALNGPAATAYGLADNRTAETAEWDFERTAELIKELKMYDFPLESLGWQSYEMDTLLAAEWRPPAVDQAASVGVAGHGSHDAAAKDPAPAEPSNATAQPSNPATADERPGLKYVPFPEDQYETVNLAVGKFRELENDPAIPDNRAIELICADWLASQA